MCLRLNKKIVIVITSNVPIIDSIVCICSLLYNQKGKKKDYNHFNN